MTLVITNGLLGFIAAVLTVQTYWLVCILETITRKDR